MITNDRELKVVRQQLERVESALASIRRDVLPKNPARFRLMSEGYLDQINELRTQVDEYLGVWAALEADAALVLGLEGAEVRLGATPGSSVTRAIDALRKGLRGIVAAVQADGGAISTLGRKPKWIEELCDFLLIGLAPGSVRVVLDEPTTSELFSQEHQQLLHRSIDLLGRVAAASSSQSDLTSVLHDQSEPVRRAALLAVRELAPPRQSHVESVCLASRHLRVQAPARISKAARTTVARALGQVGGADGDVLLIEGDIREVDLDRNEFALRGVDDVHSEWACQYEDEFVEDVVTLLGNHVAVVGRRLQSPKRPRVQVLSLAPQDTPDGDEGSI